MRLSHVKTYALNDVSLYALSHSRSAAMSYHERRQTLLVVARALFRKRLNRLAPDRYHKSWEAIRRVKWMMSCPFGLWHLFFTVDRRIWAWRWSITRRISPGKSWGRKPVWPTQSGYEIVTRHSQAQWSAARTPSETSPDAPAQSRKAGSGVSLRNCREINASRLRFSVRLTGG